MHLGDDASCALCIVFRCSIDGDQMLQTHPVSKECKGQYKNKMCVAIETDA